jgi:D-alanyl-D-alanine carboxypeptidase/D-alanyl-D-alanine-endopeptidase (penicillin-binding protein 4)
MSRCLRLIATCFIALALAPAAAPAASLPAGIEAALRTTGIPPDAVSILLQEAAAERPVLAFNAERSMSPASVMKLVTTYAGLEMLGPAFTWSTEAFATGPIVQGVLSGDLVLRGQGDPKLTIENFWLLLRGVRARGVEEIRGDLVLDRSYYGFDAGDAGSFDNEPLQVYNTLPDALLVNHKAVRLTFAPETEAKRVRILADPPLAELRIVNRLTLDSAPCGDWRARIRTEMSAEPGGAQLVFAGSYSVLCAEQSRHYSILSPQTYTGGLFRQLWSELGGRLVGSVRDGAVPPGARLLSVQESPALSEVVRDINKYSNNAMSRQLYLALGAAAFGPPATPDKSERALKQWLAQKRLDLPELVIENGSGLSRIERVSARGLGAMLAAAWRSPVMPEFIASMPVVGVDGTLRRFKQLTYARQAHIKGGTINGVRAIAGYVLDATGRRWIVACLINHPKVHNGNAQAIFDALLQFAYSRGGSLPSLSTDTLVPVPGQ